MNIMMLKHFITKTNIVNQTTYSERDYRQIWQNFGNNIELEYNQLTGTYARTQLQNSSYALVRIIGPSGTGLSIYGIST